MHLAIDINFIALLVLIALRLRYWRRRHDAVAAELARLTDRDARGRFVKRER